MIIHTDIATMTFQDIQDHVRQLEQRCNVAEADARRSKKRATLDQDIDARGEELIKRWRHNTPYLLAREVARLENVAGQHIRD